MLITVALVALIADLVFLFAGLTQPGIVLFLAGVFGATVFAMYPLIVAHANDHAEPGTFIQVSGGLLLVFGLGSIIGPTIAGLAMSSYGPSVLFAVTGIAHILLIAFALLRLRIAPAVADEDKVVFQAQPFARVSTPETAALAADAEEMEADQDQLS